MDKDALIAQLVAALDKANAFIGYEDYVPEIKKRAATALRDAQQAGFPSAFGAIYLKEGVGE